VSIESDSNDGSVEPTKAERTARDSVPESVEGAVPDPETKQAATITQTTSIPPFLVPLTTSALAPSDGSFETPGDDLDDASASALVEARRDLT